jgi:hypothetical protein
MSAFSLRKTAVKKPGACPICHDTGMHRSGGRTRNCSCPKGRELAKKEKANRAEAKRAAKKK